MHDIWTRHGSGYREPTRAEREAEIERVQEDYRESMRDARKRYADQIASIRRHRDDMLAIYRRRMEAATA
jgi:hypothetical protein